MVVHYLAFRMLCFNRMTQTSRGSVRKSRLIEVRDCSLVDFPHVYKDWH